MAAATSAGVPNRLAVVCSIVRCRSSSLVLSHTRVRIGPGKDGVDPDRGPVFRGELPRQRGQPSFAAA